MRLSLFQPELDPVDRVEIRTPCTVPWDGMHGDERIRHCAMSSTTPAMVDPPGSPTPQLPAGPGHGDQSIRMGEMAPPSGGLSPEKGQTRHKRRARSGRSSKGGYYVAGGI